MRDRLIELLMSKSCKHNKCPDDVQCDDCEHLAVFDGDAEKIADAILADGWIKPPCKIGDTVFRIVEMSTGVTQKQKVWVENGKIHGEITPCKPTIKRFIRCVTVTKNNIVDCCEDYGKTVFPTRKKAEVALRKDEGK